MGIFTLLTDCDSSSAAGIAILVRTQTFGEDARVTLTDADETRVAKSLNAILDHFIDLAAELKSARLTEAARILDEQLKAAAIALAR